MDRHLFVLNPAAGRKDSTEELKSKIAGLGLSDPYDIAVTDSHGAAKTLTETFLREHPEDFVRIYACGGDGTVCEVANGIYASGAHKCALGIVPVGSGNDFAKSFDITEEQFKNLKALSEGDMLEVDLLVAADELGQTRTSLNIISAGFDAAVAKGQAKFKKLPLVSGSMAYNISLVKCLFFGMRNYYSILVDGKPFGDGGNGPYLFTIAANGRYYGGGFKAAPYSDIRDGLLDFIRIKTVSRLKFISLVGKFHDGKHIEAAPELVDYTKCKTLKISADRPIDLNLDGEIVSMKNPEITVLPRAINIIIPAE